MMLAKMSTKLLTDMKNVAKKGDQAILPTTCWADNLQCWTNM